VTKIKYDLELMKLIALFETLTGAKVKDLISSDKLIYIIEENDMGKAIGKNGSNINRFEKLIKKQIKLIEFNASPTIFVRNLIYPIKTKEIKQEDKTIEIYGQDFINKSKLIGRNRSKLSFINDIVKRYFDIKEVKVL